MAPFAYGPQGQKEGIMPSITQEQRREVANRLQNSPAGQLDPAAPLLTLRGYCPLCGDEVTEVRDEASLREYHISGMCQGCQDFVFGIDAEGPMEVPTDSGLFEAEEGADDV